MDETLGDALAAAVRQLASRLGSDPTYREGLRALAKLVLTATEVDQVSPLAEPVSPELPEMVAEAPPELVVPPVPESPPAPRTPLPPLTLGQTTPRPPTPNSESISLNGQAPQNQIDFATISRRCALKAEATRWAANPPPVGPERSAAVNALIERGRQLPDCYLWMLHSEDTILPYRPEEAEQLAQAFEVLAGSAALLERWLDGPRTKDQAGAKEVLQLASEAQSSLRVAVESLGGRRDADQIAVFTILRDEAQARQIFIERYMRLDDRADLRALPGLRRRIDEAASRLGSATAKKRDRDRRAKTIAYHARKLQEGNGGEHDWRKIAEAADLAVSEGVPPSSPAIRESLLPIFDEMPELDDLPTGFDLVYREVDRYLAQQQQNQEAEPTTPREPTAEVLRVADALRGKTVVFIGGVPRPHNRERLRSAFALERLEWLETREHQSIAPFEVEIARPEVALVIVAIRWSSHSFEGAKAFCERHGKPMLRLKAGYSPNQVAAQVLAQCSAQLEIDLTPV